MFQQFLENYGITHKTTPFHPATNGQTKRYVQIIKQALAKIPENCNIHSELQNIFAQYHAMPHAKTRLAPANLVFNRKIRTRLDVMKLLYDKYNDNITNNDKKCAQFKIGDKVAARNYNGSSK